MHRVASPYLLLLASVWIWPSSALTQEPGNVSIKAGKEAIDFSVGDELVTRYHFARSYAKPIFWPVLAPGKVPLTRSWPMVKDIPGESTDHIHQKSAWFCHGDVIPEGIELKEKVKGVDGVDFWSEAKGHGWIVCVKVEDVKMNGPVGSVTTYNEWHTSDGVKIMEEKRT